MEKLKVGDRVEILAKRYNNSEGLRIGGIVTIYEINPVYLLAQMDGDTFPYFFEHNEVKLVGSKKLQDTASQSKQIKQALKQICTSGLVIKSEKIIDKVKQQIATDYVFGDTILRGLRQMRSDGVLDYTADKQTREYTFK